MIHVLVERITGEAIGNHAQYGDTKTSGIRARATSNVTPTHSTSRTGECSAHDFTGMALRGAEGEGCVESDCKSVPVSAMTTGSLRRC